VCNKVQKNVTLRQFNQHVDECLSAPLLEKEYAEFGDAVGKYTGFVLLFLTTPCR
jgi:hypothetical protein